MSAAYAVELLLGGPVLLRGEPAFGTPPGGVAGVHSDHIPAGTLSLARQNRQEHPQPASATERFSPAWAAAPLGRNTPAWSRSGFGAGVPSACAASAGNLVEEAQGPWHTGDGRGSRHCSACAVHRRGRREHGRGGGQYPGQGGAGPGRRDRRHQLAQTIATFCVLTASSLTASCATRRLRTPTWPGRPRRGAQGNRPIYRLRDVVGNRCPPPARSRDIPTSSSSWAK